MDHPSAAAYIPDDVDSFTFTGPKFNNNYAKKTKEFISLETPEKTHQTLVQTFEKFYTQESQAMISAIEQSREEMKNSVLEFFEEQEKYKEQLLKASKGRYVVKRRKGFLFF
jgi:hypothetical protein